MEDIERQNRCNLVAVCMKEKFEKLVYEKMSTDISLLELDTWLDPEIRKYFQELDAINRFYNPELFDDSSVLAMEEDHIRAEKSGIINYCLQIRMKKEATKILNAATSIEEADQKLQDILNNVKLAGMTVRSFYGIEGSEDTE